VLFAEVVCRPPAVQQPGRVVEVKIEFGGHGMVPCGLQ
jgi:hypothetical protein